MAKTCIIRFSSDEIAISDKPLDEVRIREARKMVTTAAVNGQHATLEDAMLFVEEQTLSKQDAEKTILSSILNAALKDAKKITKYNVILDLMAQIESSNGHIEISKEDWETIRENFEKVEERPPFWSRCKELFKQLEKPEEKEDAKVS